MVIDNEGTNSGKETEGKGYNDATPVKSPKEPKQKTINQKKKPESNSDENPKETTGKSDQSGPKPHPLNPIFILRPKRTIQPDSIKGVLKNHRKYTTFIKI